MEIMGGARKVVNLLGRQADKEVN